MITIQIQYKTQKYKNTNNTFNFNKEISILAQRQTKKNREVKIKNGTLTQSDTNLLYHY